MIDLTSWIRGSPLHGSGSVRFPAQAMQPARRYPTSAEVWLAKGFDRRSIPIMTAPHNQRRWIKNLIGLALAPVLFVAWLRWFEQRSVYQPTRQLEATGEEIGFPKQDVWMELSDGGRLHAWYYPGERAAAAEVFLLCHGNGGNISHRLDQYEALLRLGAAVLAFDYRGYGQSSGSPGEEKAYQDAETAWRWLREEGYLAEQIIVLGESLGGGVATELALRRTVGGVILQSSFTSVPDLGAEIFPWLPVRMLGRIKYDNQARLPQLTVPVLVMHSRADTIIPVRHGERNHAAARPPKLFRELRGDHNDTLAVDRNAFSDGVSDFLELLRHRGKEVEAGGLATPNAGHVETSVQPE